MSNFLFRTKAETKGYANNIKLVEKNKIANPDYIQRTIHTHKNKLDEPNEQGTKCKPGWEKPKARHS
jgi:hypothetical protein